MASTINIASPTPDGAFLVWNEDFDVDCTQQIEQGEQGSVAHLQFSTVPVATWLTCRPAMGDVRCSPEPWSAQDVSFSIPDVQIKVLSMVTIRVAIGTDVDPDTPGLTGLVSDERIIEGIRARTTWTEVGKSADTSTEGDKTADTSTESEKSADTSTELEKSADASTVISKSVDATTERPGGG